VRRNLELAASWGRSPICNQTLQVSSELIFAPLERSRREKDEDFDDFFFFLFGQNVDFSLQQASSKITELFSRKTLLGWFTRQHASSTDCVAAAKEAASAATPAAVAPADAFQAMQAAACVGPAEAELHAAAAAVAAACEVEAQAAAALESAARAREAAEKSRRADVEAELERLKAAAGLAQKKQRAADADAKPDSWRTWSMSTWHRLETVVSQRRAVPVRPCPRPPGTAEPELPPGDDTRGWHSHSRRGVLGTLQDWAQGSRTHVAYMLAESAVQTEVPPPPSPPHPHPTLHPSTPPNQPTTHLPPPTPTPTALPPPPLWRPSAPALDSAPPAEKTLLLGHCS
jgi:hypothetical protein